MNRALALILVFLGAGAVLTGFMDLLAGGERPGRLFGSFVIGPILIAVGFVVDRRPKPPDPPPK